MNRLIYRRQFILAKDRIKELSAWKQIKIGGYFLHAHEDLELTVEEDSTKAIVLLGYIFDPQKYKRSNKEILQQLVTAANGFKDVVQLLKNHVGRFVLIYKDEVSFNIIQDALALREVYYCQVENLVICGSQPNLVAKYAKPEIVESTELDLLAFRRVHSPPVRNGRLWPGESTAYLNVKHLLPNHYLNVNDLESVRYWPSNVLKRIELNEAVKKCSAFLQGAIKAIAHRHSLMMAVTAGFDSRTLLAASKEISKSIYYFINKTNRLNDQSPDIVIPKKIFEQIGLPFNVHVYSREVPEDFKDIFLSNTYLSKGEILPAIYNVYYKNHGDKINLLGVGEVGRTKFFDEPKKITPYYLAYMLRHRKSTFAVKECESWLNRSREIAKKNGLNLMTLFWWEVLIGNWGAVGNSESDIAIEEFDPFGSHFIYETFLSVDEKYRTFKNNILFKELVKNMWPELLDLPVNPTVTLKGKFQKMLYLLGVEYKIRRIHSKCYEILYNKIWKKRDGKNLYS